MGPSVEVEGLQKRFGQVEAVRDVSFTVAPGRVTGFLGPNGAGKTTTLRAVLGLVRPTAGRALVLGRPYRELEQPSRHVGAALDSSGTHPGRRARDHLRGVALAAGIPRARVEAVLDVVGLTQDGHRRTGALSLGMRQRLLLATALLGDPEVLVLDEPANGLDPSGAAWLRGLLRGLAAEGRTVLVSSHVLSEVQQTVDDVVVIATGALAYAGPLHGLGSERAVRVATLRADAVAGLAQRLERAGARVARDGERRLRVLGAGADVVGQVALDAGAALVELREDGPDLERAFLELTGAAA